MNQTFDVAEELKKLPGKPGVYIMHDEFDTVIYVGKAVNLHNRVRSYFRKFIGRGPAIDQMVEKIAYFEYIVTDSELEALVLENNLIKEHRPKYNTLLKDDKTYPYIKVTVFEAFPRLLFARNVKRDRSRYFGPYTNGAAVRDTIELLNKVYGLRNCNRNLPSDIGKERTCLNYHIGCCSGPCNGHISREEYRKSVELALDFLSGNHRQIEKELEARMLEASENLEFEEASRYRDLLANVKLVSEKQKITNSDGEDRDIIALCHEESDCVVQVFFVRDGRLIGREHYYMTNVSETSDGKILTGFIEQFYSGTPFIPKELMLQHEIENPELIEEWLSSKRGTRVHVIIPKIGQREKLVELAAENARVVLANDRERIRREEGRTIGAVKEIADLLSLSEITRMEAFDISNISGFANVGSMVVFEKGKPKRSDYRKFKIKTVAGPDDYACMREVLTRRFERGTSGEDMSSFSRLPDLLMMDGGKGQVGIALEVLSQLGVNIPVCGMVKDDNHRTRGLYYNNELVPIDTRSEGFKLITRIQDEAHRFAIEYHRSLRSKAQTHSILDEIPGVGPERRKALMRSFDSIEEIKISSPEVMSEKAGIPLPVSEKIHEFFHKNDNI